MLGKNGTRNSEIKLSFKSNKISKMITDQKVPNFQMPIMFIIKTSISDI